MRLGIICLCVGTNRVEVSDACECCFVLEKGSRHGISLSYGPDGVSFSWWEVLSSMRSPPRAGLVTERYGCSGDVGSMDFYVTNNDPSQCDSVEFELEFDGEDGDYDCDYSGLMEVVRYRVVADADWPSNKVRHVFGPTETFKAIIKNGPEFSFNAPLTPGVVDMSFDYNGSTCIFPIRVIPPSGVVGYWRANDLGCSGSDIGAGFFADVQVLPTYVSFKDLGIMEDEARVSSRWGCFEDLLSYPHDQFAHTPARGALQHVEIGDINMIKGYDHVRTTFRSLPLSNGGCTVNIPVKWGINGGPYGHDCCIVPQSVSVQTDGTVTVSKFGITARRKPNEPYQ